MVEKINRFKSLFSIDARTLYFFRKGLAAVLLYDLVTYYSDIKIFYSNEGVLPVDVQPGRSLWYYVTHLHGLNGSVEYQAFLFAIAIFFAILLFLDRAPRLAMIGSWLLFFSLCRHNPNITFGGDLYMRLFLFWGMFLPVPKNNERSCNMATAAILLQLGMIYLFAAAKKNSPVWWPQGLAVYDALHMTGYLTPIGAWVGALPMPVLRGLTYLVLITEWLVPFLIFFPYKISILRFGIVAALALMHLSFGACITLDSFTGITLVSIILLIPKEFWDRLGFFLKKDAHPVKRENPLYPVVFNRGAGLIVGVCLLLAFLSNVNTIDRFKDRIPPRILKIARSIGVDQDWRLFAPNPQINTVWFAVEGLLENNQVVDILRPGKPAFEVAEPKDYKEIIHNRHWRSFMNNILRQEDKLKTDIPLFSDYLVREWNKTHQYPETIRRIRIYKVVRNTAKSPDQGKIMGTRIYDKAYVEIPSDET